MAEKLFDSILDAILSDNKMDWKEIGLKDAVTSGKEIADRTHQYSEGDDLLSEMSDVASISSVRESWHKDASRDSDESILDEVTMSLESAEKEGKFEKKEVTEAKVQSYIRELLNKGVPPAKVAQKLEKLAEIESFDHKSAAAYLQKNAGMLGLAYLEPNKVADLMVPNNNYNMTKDYMEHSGPGQAEGYMAPNEFMPGQDPNYRHSSSLLTAWTCPKCSYEYKHEDLNPENKCPKCGFVPGKHTAGWQEGTEIENCPQPPNRRCNDNDPSLCCGGGYDAPCDCRECHPANEGRIPVNAGMFQNCPVCHGSSTSQGKPCSNCGGSGQLYNDNPTVNDRKLVGKPLHERPDHFTQQSSVKVQASSPKEYPLALEEYNRRPSMDEPNNQILLDNNDLDEQNFTPSQGFPSWTRKRRPATASSNDCVRQHTAWKKAGIAPRAKSVKQITACSGCSYFKKDASGKRCGLYKLPVVANTQELSQIVNQLTPGVPNKRKHAALVQIANRTDERVQPMKVSNQTNIIKTADAHDNRQAARTRETKVSITSSHVARLHSKGVGLGDIYKWADKKFGSFETSTAIRGFVQSLQANDKGRIVIAASDLKFLNSLGIRSEKFEGAAKCASCSAHPQTKEAKKVMSTMRVDQKFAERAVEDVRTKTAAPKGFNVKVAAMAIEKRIASGETLASVVTRYGAKFGSVKTKQAVTAFINNLKANKTKIALSQVDCTLLKNKLGMQNVIVGASKCHGCQYRNCMSCSLTGGTLLSYPGMQTASKTAADNPKDGLVILNEFDLVAFTQVPDIDVNGPERLDVETNSTFKVDF